MTADFCSRPRKRADAVSAAGLVASTWDRPYVSLLALGFAVIAGVLALLLRRRTAEPAPVQ
jgi:hypothetical protein